MNTFRIINSPNQPLRGRFGIVELEGPGVAIDLGKKVRATFLENLGLIHRWSAEGDRPESLIYGYKLRAGGEEMIFAVKSSHIGLLLCYRQPGERIVLGREMQTAFEGKASWFVPTVNGELAQPGDGKKLETMFDSYVVTA